MPRKKTGQEPAGEEKPARRVSKTSVSKATQTEVGAPARTARKGSARKTAPRRTTSFTPAAPVPLPIVHEPRPEDLATPPSSSGRWRRFDLHLHTPASHDYEQPNIHYLDILRQAERRGLDMIAFTDHNTVNGYRTLQREISELELLEKLGRIRADEIGLLSEYRRLMKKVLVLPGFEFTATFGFHVIALFPPEKSLREMEFILMQLRVPSRVLEQGLTEAGATSDVLTAYRTIDEAGGIVIAPHANSSNGVFMRGMSLGGQTRMAYTQDPHLNAIELTDLAKGRRSMAMWFSGHKPEYSRRMHIVQGSDAHRLTASPTDTKRLGMGDRATEVLLPELSFNALRDLFHSQEFDRVRPAATILDIPNDVLSAARQKGITESQSFHPSLPRRGDRFDPLLSDVVAFANSNGGTLYVGCEADVRKPATGLKDAPEMANALAEAIEQRVTPALKASVNLQNIDGTDVLRVVVPRGDEPPYVVDGNHFFVRDGTSTHAAMRDEIVALVRNIVEVSTGAPSREPEHHPVAQHTQPRHQQVQHSPQQAPPSQPSQSSQPSAPQQRQQSGGQQRPSPQQRDQGRGGQRNQQAARREPPQPGQPRQVPQPAQPAFNGSAGSAGVGSAHGSQPAQVMSEPVPPATATSESIKATQLPAPEPAVEGSPRSGVEILAVEERDSTLYYTVRDLRNKTIVRNVTQKSARDLWLYAIMQHTNNVYDENTFDWHKDRAVLSRSQRAGKVRFDLALRDSSDRVHIFFGVADDSMDSRWKELIQTVMPPEPTAASEYPVPSESATEASPSTEPGEVVNNNGSLSAVAAPLDLSSPPSVAVQAEPAKLDSPDESAPAPAMPLADSQTFTDNTSLSDTVL